MRKADKRSIPRLWRCQASLARARARLSARRLVCEAVVLQWKLTIKSANAKPVVVRDQSENDNAQRQDQQD